MKLTIPGELCDLNTYVRAERGHRNQAAAIKRDETDRVAWEARAAGLPRITTYPVWITYTWYSKDERKDTDNVAFAVKFIHDGLVDAGVLDGDGRKHVRGFGHSGFFIDRQNPRIEVTLRTPIYRCSFG